MSTVESPSAVRKVVVHLRATGDAPILKQAKFKILGTDKFAKVIEFLRRQLHRDTLFVYVNSAFSPNPDELVIDLYNNFGFDVPIDSVNTKLFLPHKTSKGSMSCCPLKKNSDQGEMKIFQNYRLVFTLVVLLFSILEEVEEVFGSNSSFPH
ncbi:hypothetical protein L3X38_016013 [Prunus dulcis]|uniref:Ubiquitin-like protein ATG12 n=1 Tax=Prunus dulcis TaxID=3755 RepID=A0AAD4Z8E3_PRUDU|nr:hypothetical protein L3X38_016013 [Prunus dulcis]